MVSDLSLYSRFLAEIHSLYPKVTLKPSHRFRFRPPNIIYYENFKNKKDSDPNQDPQLSFQSFALQLLHELGHALSHHDKYFFSIERLRIESEAWQMAKKIYDLHPKWQKKYRLHYDENFAELNLDTYRDWLHQKSK